MTNIVTELEKKETKNSLQPKKAEKLFAYIIRRLF